MVEDFDSSISLFCCQNEMNTLETDYLFTFYNKFQPYDTAIIIYVYNTINGKLGLGANISFGV